MDHGPLGKDKERRTNFDKQSEVEVPPDEGFPAGAV
jgi:hypothetical protein